MATSKIHIAADPGTPDPSPSVPSPSQPPSSTPLTIDPSSSANPAASALSPLAAKHKKKKKSKSPPDGSTSSIPRDFLSPTKSVADMAPPGGRVDLSAEPAGAYPAGAYPAGAYPAGAYPAGAYPAGAYPAGASPAGISASASPYLAGPPAPVAPKLTDIKLGGDRSSGTYPNSYTDLRKSALGKLPGVVTSDTNGATDIYGKHVMPKPKRVPTLPVSLFVDQGLPAEKALALDAGIDPDLKNTDKEAILQYRGAVRRMSMSQPKHEINAEVEAMVKYFQERTREPKFLILPESSYMGRWDMVTLAALMFTAFVTPYEVALLETDALYSNITTWDLLFSFNRLIDFIFLKDMCMQFFLAYRIQGSGGGAGLLVRNFKSIRNNYLKSWFPIDVASIIPFDWFAQIGGSDELSSLKIIKIVRLLRLLKLARIFKASRIFKRLESRLSVSYSVIGLCKFGVLLIVVGHWMACAWCMVGGGMEGAKKTTWINYVNCNMNGCDDDGIPLTLMSEWEVFSAAFYWAIVTITSVGYGDITPQNVDEMAWSTFFLLLGGCTWAYIIGSACGIVSNLDVDTIEHQQTMDALNRFMQVQGFDRELKIKVRAFFNQTKDLAKTENHKALISRMSPLLKEEVTAKNCEWIGDVYYLKNFKASFAVTLLDFLAPGVFMPQEKAGVSDALCVVSRGVASRGGVVKTAGTYWGDDFVLESWDLKDHIDCRALTYIEVLVLTRDSFFDCLEQFPTEKAEVRKATVRLAVHRGVLLFARAMRDKGLKGAMNIENVELDHAPMPDALDERRMSMDHISAGAHGFHPGHGMHGFHPGHAGGGGHDMHEILVLKHQVASVEKKMDALLMKLGVSVA